MLRWKIAIVLVFVMMIPLMGCGPKDEQEIVNDLTKRIKKLSSYETHGKLVIQTGKEPVTYDVEVWYKKPHFYRVSLKNEKKDITQILLRNQQGVFVVTPHLKKSFRFQSDWPEQGGQIYLYQTIMNSIVQDQNRVLTNGEKEYQFDVDAKYSINPTLAKQRIWLDQKLHPKKVHVFNQDKQVMAEIKFDRFRTGVSFDQDAFETERNLSEMPKRKTATVQSKPQASVDVVTPAYVPDGSQLLDEEQIQTPNGPVAIMRFNGEQPFTLTVKQPVSIQGGLPVQGEPLLLDNSIGVWLQMDQKKRISWLHNHLEYELIGDLPKEEMIKIANSIFRQPAK